MIEYILLYKEGDGFKPVTFSNGTIVIFGNKDEAESDAKNLKAKVAQIII